MCLYSLLSGLYFPDMTSCKIREKVFSSKIKVFSLYTKIQILLNDAYVAHENLCSDKKCLILSEPEV